MIIIRVRDKMYFLIFHTCDQVVGVLFFSFISITLFVDSDDCIIQKINIFLFQRQFSAI